MRSSVDDRNFLHRCHRCFNLAPWCHCTPDVAPPRNPNYEWLAEALLIQERLQGRPTGRLHYPNAIDATSREVNTP